MPEILRVQRTTGLTGRTAASLTGGQGRLWAVSDVGWTSLTLGCCAASEVRKEPILPQIAHIPNGGLLTWKVHPSLLAPYSLK